MGFQMRNESENETNKDITGQERDLEVDAGMMLITLIDLAASDRAA